MTTTTGEPARSAGLRAVLAQLAGILLALVLLPVCMLLGVPLAAWGIAFGLVIANRIVQWIVTWSVRDGSITMQLGAHGFSTIFRAMLTALALFFVGASVGAGGDQPIGMDRPDLARGAIIIFLLCFTLDAGIEAIRRAAQREELLTAGPDSTPATHRETTA